MRRSNILIIEDDKILSKTIQQCIKNNYDTDCAYDGEEGILYAKQGIYDAIILDLMMPVMDGYEFLSTLRREKIVTPVLILTAKDALEDKLKGFRIGADDYLVKPFNREELLARIDAIIRRTSGNYTNKSVLAFQDLTLDLKSRKVMCKGQELILQGKQFDLLEYLLNTQNIILTKDQIFDKIWGFDSETSTNVIEVYASRTSKRIKKSRV